METLATDLLCRVEADTKEFNRHPITLTVKVQLAHGKLRHLPACAIIDGAEVRIAQSRGDNGQRHRGPRLALATPLSSVKAMQELSMTSVSGSFPMLLGSEDKKVAKLLRVAQNLYKQAAVKAATNAGWVWDNGFVPADVKLTETTPPDHGVVSPLAVIKLNITATRFQPGSRAFAHCVSSWTFSRVIGGDCGCVCGGLWGPVCTRLYGPSV